MAAPEIGLVHCRIGVDAEDGFGDDQTGIEWIAAFRARIARETPMSHGARDAFIARTNTGSISEQSLDGEYLFTQQNFRTGEGQRLLVPGDETSESRFLESCNMDISGAEGGLGIQPIPMAITGEEADTGVPHSEQIEMFLNKRVNLDACETGVFVLTGNRQGNTTFKVLNQSVNTLIADNNWWCVTGDRVRLTFDAGGAFPTVSGTALSRNTNYWVEVISGNTFKLYYDEARQSVVDLTGDGSGTMRIQQVPQLALWRDTVGYWTRIYTGMSAVGTDTTVAIPDAWVTVLATGDLLRRGDDDDSEILKIGSIGAAGSAGTIGGVSCSNVVLIRAQHGTTPEIHDIYEFMVVLNPYHWVNLGTQSSEAFAIDIPYRIASPTGGTYEDIDERSIYAHTAARGRFWFAATSTGGTSESAHIFYYNPQAKTWVSFGSCPSYKIYAMAPDATETYLYVAAALFDWGYPSWTTIVRRYDIGSSTVPTSWKTHTDVGGKFNGQIMGFAAHNETMYAALWQPGTQRSRILKMGTAGGVDAFITWKVLPEGFEVQALCSDGNFLYLAGRERCPEGNWLHRVYYLTGDSPEEMLGDLWTAGVRDGISQHETPAIVAQNRAVYWPWDHYLGLARYDCAIGGVSRGVRPRFVDGDNAEIEPDQDAKVDSLVTYAGELYWSLRGTGVAPTATTVVYKETQRDWRSTVTDAAYFHLEGTEAGGYWANPADYNNRLWSLVIGGLPDDATTNQFSCNNGVFAYDIDGDVVRFQLPGVGDHFSWTWDKVVYEQNPTLLTRHDYAWLKQSFYDAHLPQIDKLHTGFLLTSDKYLPELSHLEVNHASNLLTNPDLTIDTAPADGKADGWTVETAGSNVSVSNLGQRVYGDYGSANCYQDVNVGGETGDIIRAAVHLDVNTSLASNGVSIYLNALVMGSSVQLLDYHPITPGETPGEFVVELEGLLEQDCDALRLFIEISENDNPDVYITDCYLGRNAEIPWGSLECAIEVLAALDGSDTYISLGYVNPTQFIGGGGSEYRYFIPAPRRLKTGVLTDHIRGARAASVGGMVKLKGTAPARVIKFGPAGRLLNLGAGSAETKKTWSLHLSLASEDYNLEGGLKIRSAGELLDTLRNFRSQGRSFYFQGYENYVEDPAYRDAKTSVVYIAHMDEFQIDEKIRKYQPTAPVEIQEL